MNYPLEFAASKGHPLRAIEDGLSKLNALLQLCFDQISGEVDEPNLESVGYALMLCMEQADAIEAAADRLRKSPAAPETAKTALVKVA